MSRQTGTSVGAFVESIRELFPADMGWQILKITSRPEGLMIERKLGTPCLVDKEGHAYAGRNDGHMHLISVLGAGDAFEAELSARGKDVISASRGKV